MSAWRRDRACAVAMAAALAATACGHRSAEARQAAEGRELAARHCAACHLLPAPAELDSATWRQWVLPRMARRLGLAVAGAPAAVEAVDDGTSDGRRVREAGVFPRTPALSRAEWERIEAYYLGAAPTRLPRPAAPAVATGNAPFRARAADFRVANPMIALVRIDTARRRIYVSDATFGASTLAMLDGAGRTLATWATPSPVTHVEARGDTLAVAYTGRLNPSDAPSGSLALGPGWRPGATAARVWGVDSLQRPVHASWVDLSGDGVEDVVVSEFGNLTGRLAWYERLPAGARRHLLAAQPGTIETIVRDVDGDGRADVLALTAQGDEGVSLFRRTGDGGFAREQLLRFPPSYGSTSMTLADVDGDGRDDIVYTNGDAGDFPGPTRPYHGVRVFVNDGRGGYAERYFLPMPGAYDVAARDFDGDGDVDLAAVAFFTDSTASPPLPFVYLENRGGLRFHASTVAGADRGRWLRMDAGDVDGDGDDDLVLGAFARLGAFGNLGATGAAPTAAGPAVLILENVRAAQPGAARPVLAVFAHPDDERIVGPLLSRLAREGRETHLVIATDGSQGVRDFAGIPAGARLAAVRTGEAGCAAERLGVRRLHLLGLPDGGLASFDALGRLRSGLVAIIDSLRPAAIITFGPEGGTGHPDHRLVGDVVTEIVQGDPRHADLDLLYASLPTERLRTAPPAEPTVRGMAEALLTVRVPFEARDLAAVREAFACHRSQYAPAEREAVNRYLAHAWNGMVWLRPWNGQLHDPRPFGP
ncbi:MAG TPA: PIG-L family deacetylase [Gemmatimonadaceae bacterium]|nr:PIG-L family deacetylase [Gemmatimonadaceae bacterium]